MSFESLRDGLITEALKMSLRASFKFPSMLPLPLPLLRAGMEQSAKLFRQRPDVLVEQTVLGGVEAERLSHSGPVKRALLHFHGGAFMVGSAKTHRAFGTELAASSQATVFMLNYRLAPEHPYPAALDDALAAYAALLAEGFGSEQIFFGGDSGGCALALSAAIALREKGMPIPAGLILISPYVDLSLTSASVALLKHRDPMVSAKALSRGANGYRGSIAAVDARVSPLFANLNGLPPTLIQAGSLEILRDDATGLISRLEASDVQVTGRIFPGMWHNFQMFSQFIPAARHALEDIAAFIRSQSS